MDREVVEREVRDTALSAAGWRVAAPEETREEIVFMPRSGYEGI